MSLGTKRLASSTTRVDSAFWGSHAEAMMGGALTVTSVEGQGTTVTPELSLAMEPA